MLTPFALEDFFYEFEHKPGLINLASSDSQPWAWTEIASESQDWQTALSGLTFGYPDTKGVVLPSLQCLGRIPAGHGVLPTSGAAEAIFLALSQAVYRSQKKLSVAVPHPGYGAFEGIAQLLGCSVSRYHYRREREWSIDDEELLGLAVRCDVVLVNDPHNPSGQVVAPALLREVIRLVESHSGTMVLDKVFADTPLPVDLVRPATMIIGSLSKIHGFPGLRFGWAVAPDGAVDRMRTLQQYLSLSVNAFAARVAPVILKDLARFSRVGFPRIPGHYPKLSLAFSN